MEADLQCSNAVLDVLLCEYGNSIQGPGKRKNLQSSYNKGPVIDLIRRLIDEVESDKMALLNKRLEGSESEKFEYVKRYEDAIND
ncbi:hypothetical protein VNO77_21915 [Canavalia gladiata]|uniref:Uncharacterized protein n=1 Tax=Canavalia gladiata TaxID=3824 RepID=A0AAN9L4V9_CANGL